MEDDRLLYRVSDVARITCLSVQTIYREIARGKLLARKIGCATVVEVAEIRRYIAALPPLVSHAQTRGDQRRSP